MAKAILVAIPIFDHVTALDAVGAYEILGVTPGVSVVFVSDKPGTVLAGQRSKLGLVASASFQDVPKPDIIVVPGGPPDKLPLHHEPLLNWIRKAHETTMFTTSVCTGSLILASAGLLEGVEATTHWSAYAMLEKLGAKAAPPSSKRYIQQGRIITAAGVSAGIDMALHLVYVLTDEKTAQGVQLILEYDPQPPYIGGSMEKAGPEIVARAGELLSSRFD